MEYQAKLKWKKHTCFTLYFKFWRYSLKIATSSFIFCFTTAFTSTDIIFYNFSELDWKLSKIRFSSQIFLFQRILQAPQHLLVTSAPLLCRTQNILTLSMSVYYNTNSFFLRRFSPMHCLDGHAWSVQFINQSFHGLSITSSF